MSRARGAGTRRVRPVRRGPSRSADCACSSRAAPERRAGFDGGLGDDAVELGEADLEARPELVRKPRTLDAGAHRPDREDERQAGQRVPLGGEVEDAVALAVDLSAGSPMSSAASASASMRSSSARAVHVLRVEAEALARGGCAPAPPRCGCSGRAPRAASRPTARRETSSTLRTSWVRGDAEVGQDLEPRDALRPRSRGSARRRGSPAASRRATRAGGWKLGAKRSAWWPLRNPQASGLLFRKLTMPTRSFMTRCSTEAVDSAPASATSTSRSGSPALRLGLRRACRAAAPSLSTVDSGLSTLRRTQMRLQLVPPAAAALPCGCRTC